MDLFNKQTNPMLAHQAEEYYSDSVSIKIASAIQKDDIDLLEDLVKSPDFKPEDHGKRDVSLILWAASLDNINAISVLIKAGVPVDDVMVFNRINMNMVSIAVSSRNPEFLKILLDEGANPNGVGDTEAPLITAIFAKRWDRFDLLINKGADIEKQDDAGVTPLIQLALVSEYEQVLKLLKLGANPEHKTILGMSLRTVIDKFPLDLSSEAGKAQQSVVDFLKKNNSQG